MIQKRIFFSFIMLLVIACLNTTTILGMDTDPIEEVITEIYKVITVQQFNQLQQALSSVQTELNTKTQELKDTQDIASQKTTELQQAESALQSANDDHDKTKQQLQQYEAFNWQQETILNETNAKLNSAEAAKSTFEKKLEDQKKHIDSAYFKFNSNNIGKNLNSQNQQLYDAGYAAAINIAMEQIYIPYAAKRHFIDTQQKDDTVNTLRSNTIYQISATAYGLGQDKVQTTQNPGLTLLYATGNSLWFTSHNFGLRILGRKIANTEIGKKVIAASGYKNLSPALQTTLEEGSLLVATIGIQMLEVKTFGNKKNN